NPTLTITKDRFDTEILGGPLGDLVNHPWARTSYVAKYYDAANRLTDTVNAGTNGGTPYNPPPMPDTSQTVLRTNQSYAADAVQQVSISGLPSPAPMPPPPGRAAISL